MEQITITMKYTRKSFWGTLSEYTEDNAYPDTPQKALELVEKGLKAVTKSDDYTLQIAIKDTSFIIWSDPADQASGLLTVGKQKGCNFYQEYKLTKQQVRKLIKIRVADL